LTSIEWTNDVWNPLRGCTRISPGCENCYAERIAARFSGPGMPYEGLAKMTEHGPRWTGEIRLLSKELDKPLHWKKPRLVFVNSMSDLFHEKVPFEFIDQVFATMAWCPQHVFQILTKRPERMQRYSAELASLSRQARGVRMARSKGWNVSDDTPGGMDWPLPNVWLGVSVENQEYADLRIPHLLKTPAAVRFLSCEPLLGELDLHRYLHQPWLCEYCYTTAYDNVLPEGWGLAWGSAICPDCGPKVQRDGGISVVKGGLYATGPDPRPWKSPIHWVIAGCESGPGARPMDEDWVRSLRDQCVASEVPFFFKQRLVNGQKVGTPELGGRTWTQMPNQAKEVISNE
jgi:protein gp37